MDPRGLRHSELELGWELESNTQLESSKELESNTNLYSSTDLESSIQVIQFEIGIQSDKTK